MFERVYETGPVFRAEPHDTARHLAEYVSLDAEAGFIGDHRDVLAVLRHALAGMTAAIGAQAQEAAGRFGVTVPEVPAQIPVIHFRDAPTSPTWRPRTACRRTAVSRSGWNAGPPA